jgi:5-methylcytosine-specific restriction endonuclease McrA
MVDKICRVCGILKDLLEFYPHKGMLDGHLNMCKACSIVKAKEWNYKNNRKIYLKEYYEKNKEKLAKSNKERWWLNRDKNLEASKLWKKNNKDKVRYSNRKRRELKDMNDFHFLKEHEDLVFSLFGFKCFKCGKDDILCLDHHVPLSKGGKLILGNVSVLCGSCNTSKKDKMPEKYYTKDELYELNILLEKQKIRGQD